MGCTIEDNIPWCKHTIENNLFTHIIYWTTSLIVCVIRYRITTTHGTMQMNLSAENKVDTTNITPMRNNAALVDTEDADIARDNTKPCMIGYVHLRLLRSFANAREQLLCLPKDVLC